MNQDDKDSFYGERREGGIYLLSYGVVAVEVPSLPAVTPCQKGDEKFVDADVDNNRQGSRAARSSSHPLQLLLPETISRQCSRLLQRYSADSDLLRHPLNLNLTPGDRFSASSHPASTVAFAAMVSVRLPLLAPVSH